MSSKKKEPQLQEVSLSLPDRSVWHTWYEFIMTVRLFKQMFCLVSEFRFWFIFRCHEAAKPGRLLWVSTGMPCSNSFPGLFEKEMCALLYRTSEVDRGCCSLWINPRCTTTSWHFLSYDELSHLLQNNVFLCFVMKPCKPCPYVRSTNQGVVRTVNIMTAGFCILWDSYKTRVCGTNTDF